MTLSSSFGMDRAFGFLELAPRSPPLGIFQINTTDKSNGAGRIHEASQSIERASSKESK